jgi:hypothetical protein
MTKNRRKKTKLKIFGVFDIWVGVGNVETGLSNNSAIWTDPPVLLKSFI